MPSQEDELERAILRTQRAVELWIETRENRKVHVYFSRRNQLRLLVLRTWALKYYLTIPDILDMIVKPLRRYVNPKAAGKMLLGVSLATLTGSRAEAIVQEKIQRRYPGNEHIDIWRMRERRRQIELELRDKDEDYREPRVVSRFEAPSMELYIAAYKRRSDHRRAIMKNEETKKWRKRKHYRLNPWL